MLARMRLFPKSTMSATVPAEFMVMARGRLNVADVPTPLACPTTPAVPARVDTAALEMVTARSRSFALSATNKTLPAASREMP